MRYNCIKEKETAEYNMCYVQFNKRRRVKSLNNLEPIFELNNQSYPIYTITNTWNKKSPTDIEGLSDFQSNMRVVKKITYRMQFGKNLDEHGRLYF